MESPTSEEIDRETEKSALESLIKPDLQFRDVIKLSLEESDYNQVLKRITSIPGWREDTQLVKMFVVVRQRKRWFLNVPFIEEDLEIVPIHVYFPPYQLPDLTKFSEEERKLTVLVLSFVGFKGRSQEWKRVYEGIYEQIYAIKDWEQSAQLLYLHSLMKEEEKRNSFKRDYYEIIEKQRYNEEYKQKRRTKAKDILKEIHKERKKNPIASQEQLVKHIHIIRTVAFWTDDQQLLNQRKKLVGELRVLRFKKDGIWKDRVQGMSESKETDETIKSTDQREHSEDELTEHKSNSSPAPIEKDRNRLRSIWSLFWKSEDSQKKNS